MVHGRKNEGVVMLVLRELSEKEMDEYCKLPRDAHAQLFRGGELWFKRNKHMLRSGYAGEYVLLNVENFSGVAAQNFDKALKQYSEKYGPTPFEGRPFLGIQL